MNTKLKLKGIFITEDGENFLCVRQIYLNELRTGRLLDEKMYQGRRFKLIEESNERPPHSQN